MADMKDILGVPRNAVATEDKKPEKKERMKRPEGMSREAFALLGGSNPIIPRHMLDGFKKKDKQQKPKPSAKGTVVYRRKPFKNQARSDNLELVHWVKGFKDATGRIRDAHEGDYVYAKYNKKVMLYKYDDEEWETLIKADSAGWSKEETDYLLDLCELYDLRFVVIIDRYQFPAGPKRTMEDLKERYYGIARKLLIAREGTDATIANHTLVRHPYNATHERNRKQALLALLQRNPQQEEQENLILEQARQIEDKRKAEAAAAAAAAAAAVAQAKKTAAAVAGRGVHVPDLPFSPEDLVYQQGYPNTPGNGIPSLLNHNLEPVRPAPGIYARSAHMQTVLAQQASALMGTSTRNQKLVEQTLTELGYAGQPRVHTRAVVGAYLALRGEICHMLELKRQIQNRGMGDGKTKRKKGDDGPSMRTEKRQRVAKRFD